MPTNRIPKGLENRVQVATIKARRVDNKEVILGKRNENNTYECLVLHNPEGQRLREEMRKIK